MEDLLRLIHTEVIYQFVRSSGAGGQNVNKVSSKVQLRWNLISSNVPEPVKTQLLTKLESQLTNEGDIMIACDEFRDQPRNRARCFEKFRELIIQSLKKPKRRIATKPTYSSRRKRVEGKRKHQEKKSDRKKIAWD